MELARVRQVLGGISIGGGTISLWLAFERQMCLGGGCAPNIVYLVPGVLAVLVGVGLIRLRLLTLIAGALAASTVLYGGFVLLVRDETLFIGFLFVSIALLFAAFALGAEALCARYGQRQSSLPGVG